jgi:tryptophanyl-tRNA synthetase
MAHRDMSEMTRIAFYRNDLVIEPTIYNAATQILTGLIAADKMSASNEQAIIKKSIELALELAVQTDKMMDVNEGETGINKSLI